MATDRDPNRDGALQEWAERGLTKLRLLSRPAAPPRARDGDVAYADGTNWNPSGTGAGIYWYGLGSWYRLATGAGIPLVDGDKGDVVVSGTGLVWTIDNDAVTYAKMQNVSATDKVLGRASSGAGNVEEIACTAAGRALIDDASAADQRTTLGLGALATVGQPGSTTQVIFNDGGTMAGDSGLTWDKTNDVLTVAGGVVLPKTSGKGIKVDAAAPTFGWRDIIGTPQEPVSGGGKPTWTQIATSGVYTWAFATTDIQYYAWHLPHDYVPSSDIHFHAHWFGPQTASGYTKWQFDYLYAKGHNQAAFPTTVTSVTVEQQQSATAYQHMIAETAAVTISGLEPDGLILCKVSRIAPAGTDVVGSVFVPVVDLHYQSTNLATKSKAPDFYT